MSHRCKKCTDNNYSCTCKRKCNTKCNSEKDNCKPKCDPCDSQQELLYCGVDVGCTGLKKGNTLDKSLEDISKIVCGIKTTITGIGKNLEYEVVGGDNTEVTTETEGKLTTFKIDVNMPPIEVTYEDLEILISNSGLIIGRFYDIIDYQNIYEQPGFLNNITPDIDLEVKYGNISTLRVFATGTNMLMKQAWRPSTPEIYLEYDVKFNETEVMQAAAKGRIIRCIDENQNDTNYDHTEILFKRYKVLPSDTEYLGFYGSGTDFIEVKTFGTGCFYNIISDGNKTVYSGELSDFYLSNNSFGNSCSYNKIGESSANNVFSNSCKYNVLGDFSTGNVIREGCETNILKSRASLMVLNKGCKDNIIGQHSRRSFLGEDCVNNVFEGYFTDTTLGDGAINNKFSKDFRSNVVGPGFKNNDIKCEYVYEDLTSATHVYADYNCEIIKVQSGVAKLTYMDSAGALQVADVTN